MSPVWVSKTISWVSNCFPSICDSCIWLKSSSCILLWSAKVPPYHLTYIAWRWLSLSSAMCNLDLLSRPSGCEGGKEEERWERMTEDLFLSPPHCLVSHPPRLVHIASLNMACTPNYSLIAKPDKIRIYCRTPSQWDSIHIAHVWPMYCIVA